MPWFTLSPPPSPVSPQYARQYYDKENLKEKRPLIPAEMPGYSKAVKYERDQAEANAKYVKDGKGRVPTYVPSWTAVSKEEPAIPPELVQYRQDRTSDNNKCGAIGVAYSSGIRPNLARRGSLGPHFPPSLPPTAVYGASAHKRKPKDENAGRCEARLQPQRPMKVDYVGSSKCRNAPGNCVENVTLPKLLEAGHRRITTTVIGNKVPTLKPPCDQCKALLGAFGDKYGAVFVDGATGERYMGRKQRAFTS